MMHETGCRPTSSYGSLQGGQHELCAHMVGDGPSDDAAAVEVDDDGQVQPAGPGAHVRDVRGPDDDTGNWDRSTAAVILGLVLLPVLLRLFMG